MAIAAQETHKAGNQKSHFIKIGSIIKFKTKVQKIIYIGNFTSQIPLKIDWNIEKTK